MNILRFAAEVFLIYLLYKLVFDFIIPVYRTSKRVKKQFTEMQSNMEEQMRRNNAQNFQPSQPASARPKKKREEYIDYEEIKE